MKKQTAVEWLAIKFSESSEDELAENINLWFGQAKAMEEDIKEHDIRFAYMAGFNKGLDNNPNHLEEYIKFSKTLYS